LIKIFYSLKNIEINGEIHGLIFSKIKLFHLFLNNFFKGQEAMNTKLEVK
jgi:hypothetical protein